VGLTSTYAARSEVRSTLTEPAPKRERHRPDHGPHAGLATYDPATSTAAASCLLGYG
jgi:hypothetical protein